MLLSLYASYHWANISKNTYVLRMTVFVILVSFISAYAPLPWGGILLTFPLLVSPVLSFPLYGYVDEVLVGNLFEGAWVSFRGIRFLTIDMYYARMNWALTSMQFIITFSFFLFINFVGVIFGYEISRIRRICEWGTRREWNVLGVILWGVFMAIGLWLGEQSDIDALALFYFGIIVLAIVVGRILWAKIEWNT